MEIGKIWLFYGGLLFVAYYSARFVIGRHLRNRYPEAWQEIEASSPGALSFQRDFVFTNRYRTLGDDPRLNHLVSVVRVLYAAFMGGFVITLVVGIAGATGLFR